MKITIIGADFHEGVSEMAPSIEARTVHLEFSRVQVKESRICKELQHCAASGQRERQRESASDSAVLARNGANGITQWCE